MSDLSKDFAAVFGSDAGKRVLAHLVGVSGFMRAADVKDGFRRYDPEQAAYEAGRKDMVGYVLGMVGARLDLTPARPVRKPRQKKDIAV